MIRIQHRPLMELSLNPFGRTAKAIEPEGEKLRVLRGSETALFYFTSVNVAARRLRSRRFQVQLRGELSELS